MQEIVKLGIGIIILILGWFIGILLAKVTKEELKSGQKWFRLIIFFCLIGAIISIFIKSDILFFSLLFIAIVTNKSLKKRK